MTILTLQVLIFVGSKFCDFMGEIVKFYNALCWRNLDYAMKIYINPQNHLSFPSQKI